MRSEEDTMFAGNGKSRSAGPTVIGHKALVQGSIRLESSLQIDGRIEGIVIVEGVASIGPTGCVIGDMFAEDDLTVVGRIEGNVSVRKHLRVTRDGCIIGHVRYGSLQVDRGGVLTGSTAQGEDTISMDNEVEAADATTPDPLPA
jgi:cytoskeletal protein CcmA (bactofilin family)